MNSFVDKVTENHEAYATDVLKPKFHYMIVRNLDRYAKNAGIPPKMIYTELAINCTEVEIEWMKEQHDNWTHDIFGLAYVGHFHKPVMQRMCALAGCFIRNFMSAKVLMLNDLIMDIANNSAPEDKIILIPNFYFSGKDVGARLWEKDINNLLGYLYSRRTQELTTIVYIEDMMKMTKDYGKSFKMLFDNYTHFKQGDLNEA